MPEYFLIFRKPPTDSSKGYADVPVVKDKAEYSRPRWQIDAHGLARSSGNRLLSPEDFNGVPHKRIFKMFRQYWSTQVYDLERHVALANLVESVVGSSLAGYATYHVLSLLMQVQHTLWFGWLVMGSPCWWVPR